MKLPHSLFPSTSKCAVVPNDDSGLARDRATLWQVPALPGVDIFQASFKRFAYARHAHDVHALGLIDGGVQTFRYGRKRYFAPAETIIVVNPGEAHDGEAATDAGYRYRMLYINKALLRGEDERPSWSDIASPTIADRLLAHSLAKLLDLLNTDVVRREPGLSVGVQEQLVCLLEDLGGRHAGRKMPDAHHDPGRMARVRDYLSAHMHENPSLSEAAAVAGLSPFHLLRCFKRPYGVTPHAFLMTIRLQEARRLLGAGEPIAAVASSVGFADQAHLTRKLKATYGVTPGRLASLGAR